MLHEGAKRCEGTVALYTVGAKARLGRALGGATVGIRDTFPPPNTKPKSLEADPPLMRSTVVLVGD
jgi:hypothetical protein